VLAALWLHPGTRLGRRLLLSGTVALTAGVIMAGGARLHLYADTTQNRRNSFPAADAAALAALPERLTDRNRQCRLLRRVADAPDRLGELRQELIDAFDLAVRIAPTGRVVPMPLPPLPSRRPARSSRWSC
jgi:hypothetical protein